MSAPTGRVTPISGFPEYLPADRIVEQRFLDVIRETFELHGFSSIETRSIEPVERLSAQGEDADKEIYGVSRLGASPDDDDARWGLHFDLTVPFARYVVENAGRLSFPFRRYQIQKAWRGSGRRRGGTASSPRPTSTSWTPVRWPPHFEAEMPLVVADVFSRFPVGDFVIQVNNLKIPEGFYLAIGLTDVVGTLRIVDKLDKVGPEKVAAMLAEAGASSKQAAACLALAGIRSADLGFVSAVRDLGVSHPTLDEGLDALSAVMSTAMEYAPGRVVADLRIARGLDYYTGRSTRQRSWGTSRGARSARVGAMTRWRRDGRTTYPGSGSRSGCPGSSGCCSARTWCWRPGRARRRCWWR